MKVLAINLSLIISLSNLLQIESLSHAGSECGAQLVESIPIGLTYNSTIISKPTFDGLIGLVSSANSSIEIASLYWTLQGSDVMPHPDNSSLEGTKLLNALIDSSKSRSVKIRIAVNEGNLSDNSTDLALLKGLAQIREVNFNRLLGAGVLHTKFFIIDNKHLYIGSANMDWRSLTQVKELGIVLNDCQTLANDLSKIFEVYWYLGVENSTIPKQWPQELATDFNATNPLSISMNQTDYSVYLSSSPKPFCPFGRTNDIDAILSIIENADKFIDIAVMDYFPIFLYQKNTHFWPLIDNALKSAVIDRKVSVRLLASHWNHTRESMPIFLHSLAAFNDKKLFGATIEVKLFVVPAFTPFQASIPFARVNHNKYMVTDKTAYIGTSNWSADYFVNTGGVGFAITSKNNTSAEHNLRDDLQSIFQRDWDSSYAKYI
ncbi:unnamed protein product [Medioppia subpectinata]|uniref:PLD phosphodiesterase domain-containing protein n=1 Tax=Medioppia subpectinata TaxID=1979941 RepID=A0A7R9Q573_9ACAR|nr:unnamed protein product [Medioppia subpectinata]CAG2112046.1 unnamed protein product [Medioppia subpectinata]